MALTVSVRDLTPADISQQRTQTMRDIMSILKPLSGGQPLVVRDVRPTDFNNGTLIGQLDTPTLTADTYSTDVYSTWTKLLSNQQVLAITGFANLSGVPKLDEARFVASGMTLSINELDLAYCNTLDSRVFFFPPIVWVPGEHVQIDLLSHAGATNHQQAFMWLGMIAESQSVIVPPRQIGAGAMIPGMI